MDTYLKFTKLSMTSFVHLKRLKVCRLHGNCKRRRCFALFTACGADDVFVKDPRKHIREHEREERGKEGLFLADLLLYHVRKVLILVVRVDRRTYNFL